MFTFAVTVIYLNILFIYFCSHSDFVTIIDLPEGEHQYKFCVDGNWQCDPKVVSLYLENNLLNTIEKNELIVLIVFSVYD